MQAVTEIMTRNFRERRFRPPERDDIIIDLAAGRQFDKINRAFSPVSQRLDPGTRTVAESALDIFEIVEGALPLEQPESFRRLVGER